MKIGVPREVKADEYRIAITPALCRELNEAGHRVVIESGAGVGAGFADEVFSSAGAEIAPGADEVFARTELILKVKEPQPAEIERLEPRHTLFSYLHLAPDRELTDGLLSTGATCIAYETVEDERGRLPLLAPMSEIAGRIAAHSAAQALEKPHGGSGVLIGGIPGVSPARVLVIGGGVVGQNAAQVALGMGADVCIFDRSLERLRELDSALQGRAELCYSSPLEIEDRLPAADVVIGAVLLKGATAPRILDRAHLKMMRPFSVLIDVAIDQGGCFETSRPTNHSQPSYELDGILHYCVANLPGAVPVTSTRGLAAATGPFVKRLAAMGTRGALTCDAALRRGLNAAAGMLASEAVALSQQRDWIPLEEAAAAAIE